jgi:probable DNA repair protein
MAPPLLSPELARALDRGATVLTANQRAARTLRRQVDLDHRAQGVDTWQTPTILAWESWTSSLWRLLLLEGRASALLLNPAQQHSLWRSLIAADPDWIGLPSADALAELAADAFARLCAHSAEARLGRDTPSADTQAFARWARGFAERCREDDLLPAALLEARLTQSLTPAELPRTLLLLGFDTLTPARQAVLNRLKTLGVTVESLPLPEPGSLNLCAAPSEDDELDTAARWLRDRLAADPTARLALIVPGLAGRRAEIDRVLRRTLSPAATVGETPRFEFSLGLPLDRLPIVAVALDLLRWPSNAQAADGLSRERITRLLLSPALAGHQAERSTRAAADARFRRERSLRPEISLDRLLQTLDTARCPLLQASLHAFARVAKEITPQPRSHSDWAQLMRRLLAAARWGEAADSLTFQAIERWESVLEQAATLDFTGLRVRYGEALAAVERLTHSTLFAPESDDAPIQIMGPLESAGSTFDALWFLGAGDLTWPTRPATSPLLSRSLEREFAMPGTSPADDLAHARHMASRLSRSAPTVLFSHAQKLADDTAQRPSPALSDLPLRQTTTQEIVSPSPPHQPVELERLNDDHTLPPLPDTILRGGASILRDQAACGFRAFAQHRLFASALDSARPNSNFGLDPRDSGKAVHQVLQLFWSRFQDQETLRALPPLLRRAALADAIEQTLTPLVARNPGRWSATYLDLQCERLLTLLDSWLLRELERQVPFHVRALETRLPDARIGPLRLTVQVDRIDETEHGDLILDYKTGRADPGGWLDDRPDEPQLPLYAILASAGNHVAPLAGLAFAHLRTGEDMTLHGFQAHEGLLLKAAPLGVPFASQLDTWKLQLEALATDFHRGDVRVRPKDYPRTCQYCEQRLLCRLDLSLLQTDSTDDGDIAEDDIAEAPLLG